MRFASCGEGNERREK
jgi:hypothetical protein